ncbi:MAG TPA: hypothetical protein VEC11_08435 [Allosphingosinicella sp.]|nr:hypothetical protein [Allosphingosinicella sp.]
MIDVGYQMPLFEWYSIHVEFAQRREWVLGGLRSNWQRVQELADEEIIFRYWSPDLIVPIDLYDYERTIEKRARTAGSFDYEARIQYVGDDQLWRLYPGPLETPLPDGEIFQGCLVLTFIAGNDADAKRIIEAKLDRIKPILEMQRDRIDEFHLTLTEVIRAEIDRLRAGGGACSAPGGHAPQPHPIS